MPRIPFNWGATEVEIDRGYPCDEVHPAAPIQLFRAVDVAAPAEATFRWLCQLRIAPYSYDWIDNWGRRSPRELTRGMDELEAGQRVMTIFELVSFEAPRHLTIEMRRGTGIFGPCAVTYSVEKRGESASRLLMKIAASRERGLITLPGIAKAFGLGDLIMARRQLLNLKALAESGDIALGS